MHKKFLKRLQKLIDQSPVLPIDDQSKLIFFSDCHRGYGGHADDFAHNQLLFIRALTHYKKNDYTYIELGDGDELWENKDFERIKDNYRTLFELFQSLHSRNRLYLLWGNHNRRWKRKRKVNKGFATITDDKTGKKKPLFKDLTIHESLLLQYKNEKNKILLLHGHQGDCLNDT
ncbi:serine/threonine protein phosphatase, partial [bacterium]|nr:serine/threonine protein phosphatase [bacterium]